MFNNNLKKLRLASGLSQKQIADYLHITPQSVSKWENGDALPTIDYLPKLAECLNCDINVFFAPMQKTAIDSNVLYNFFVLVNDVVFTETKTTEDIVAFENEHPSSIATAINFFEDLRKRKTLTSKALQKMLGCAEEDTRLFIKQLIVGEMLENLDIKDTYFVLKDEVKGLIVFLNFYQTHQEVLRDPEIDFKASFLEKIDNMSRNDE